MESEKLIPDNNTKSTNSSDREKYPLLSRIDSPADLKALPLESLPQVCDELRKMIIATCSVNPGHFASSMGAVELTVALHYVFSTPEDKIVWDVGHQAYSHKILTGRRDRFHTLRTREGLSGFPRPGESEYDTFTAGHASNSISAALGMSVADHLTPSRSFRHAVAVIGDASISGGLAFEGLNNAANIDNNLLIVLNDNDMSIDKNVGALHRYLSRLTTSTRYNSMRRKAYNSLRRHGILKEGNRGMFTRFTNSLKSVISRRQNIFEGLNVRYFGPVDGHDVINLVRVFNEIKNIEGPRILHLTTVKGKGYKPAEMDPTVWHAPGAFDAGTGARNKSKQPAIKWQDAMADMLCKMAEHHEDIVGITAAMPSGTSMSKLIAKYPSRGFDVGISEGHAVTFAGGLAANGKHPFVAIYSSFLQRAYDNIIHDVAIASLPVTFLIDRAGLVGEDGVTHHGLFDLAYLSVIPGLKIASPMDIPSLHSLMLTAYNLKSPMAIRYPRGNAPLEEKVADAAPQPLPLGKGRCISETKPGNPVFLSIGPLGNEVKKAVGMLRDKGIDAGHYDMIWLKPTDNDILEKVAAEASAIFTVEDASIKGGLGSAVLEWLSDHGNSVPVHRFGIPMEKWISHATVKEQYVACGIDAASMAAKVAEVVENLSRR